MALNLETTNEKKQKMIKFSRFSSRREQRKINSRIGDLWRQKII